MPHTSVPEEDTHHHIDIPRLVSRSAIGGTLMGLANLVPGISGGTMLLAAGVYPGFIASIAELTTLRFRTRSIVLLGTVAATAGLAILLLAGTVKGLVQDYRWVMYSLFIGLTLGGVPLIWRMARPASPAVFIAAASSFALMAGMALVGGPGIEGGRNVALIFLAGLAASSAMILPGVSGSYLLILLGQYENILGTVDQLKRGLVGDGGGFSPDFALILDTTGVVIPLGLGVVVGIVGRVPQRRVGLLQGPQLHRDVVVPIVIAFEREPFIRHPGDQDSQSFIEDRACGAGVNPEMPQLIR